MALIRKIALNFFATFIAVLLLGLMIRVGQQVYSEVTCSPVVTTTNQNLFGTLMKEIVSNYLVPRLQATLMQKKGILYLPGNLTGLFSGNLTGISDFGSLAKRYVFVTHSSLSTYVNTNMTSTVYSKLLNANMDSHIKAALQRALPDEEGKQAKIEAFARQYHAAFLTAPSTAKIYTPAVNQYRGKILEYIPVATDYCSEAAILGGKLDIADTLQDTQRAGQVASTASLMKEGNILIANGMKGVAVVYGHDLNYAMANKHASANTAYLGNALKNAFGGKLDDAAMSTIVSSSNAVAASMATNFLATSVSNLSSIGKSANQQMVASIASAVSSAFSSIQSAALKEQVLNFAIQTASKRALEQAKSFANSSGWTAAASGNLSPSITSAVDSTDFRNAAVLVAGTKTSGFTKRVAMKALFISKESYEVATAIQERLRKFDPSIIDGTETDRAWKDAGRLQYYHVLLANQMQKLLGVKAMLVGIASASEDTRALMAKESLPDDF